MSSLRFLLFLVFTLVGVCKLEATLQNSIHTKSTCDVNPELVDALLKYGQNPKGWCPLNYALEVEDFSAALVLVNFIEDINKKDGAWLPLERLCNKIKNKLTTEQEELLRVFFILHGKSAQGLSSEARIFHIAGRFGSFDLINWLLAQNIDLNELNGYPFLGAVQSGDLILVQHLLTMNVKLDRMVGVLNTAVTSGNLELVRFLWEELGQRPYKPWGNPLAISMNNRNLDVFKYLLEVGVDPNEGYSLLKSALGLPNKTLEDEVYKIQIVNLLIQYGAKY